MKRASVLLLVLLCLLMCACGADKAKEAAYSQAQALLQGGAFSRAADALAALGEYKDSQYLLQEAELARDYEEALALLAEKDYPGAYTALCELGNYKDVPKLLERFQKVLLTEDNWDTYFEICDELDRSEAKTEEAGGYSGMQIQYAFVLKEEYHNCLYNPEANKTTAGLTASYKRMTMELDEETGAYTFAGGDLGSVRKAEIHELEDGCKALIATARVARSHDDEGRFVGYMVDGWVDIEVTSFSGELYLYQE